MDKKELVIKNFQRYTGKAVANCEPFHMVMCPSVLNPHGNGLLKNDTKCYFYGTLKFTCKSIGYQPVRFHTEVLNDSYPTLVTAHIGHPCELDLFFQKIDFSDVLTQGICATFTGYIITVI